jgi:CBS domain containing-hemolysin-like protein
MSKAGTGNEIITRSYMKKLFQKLKESKNEDLRAKIKLLLIQEEIDLNKALELLRNTKKRNEEEK